MRRVAWGLTFLSVVATAASVSLAQTIPVQPRVNGQAGYDRYRLTFQDEFAGTTLDATKWTYEFTGKRRDAWTTPDAVRVADGSLIIDTWTSANPRDGTPQHNTGAVSTRGLFKQAYGFWEARADWDSSPGMWSAFWVHAFEMTQVGSDPTRVGRADLYGTEIDVAEHRIRDRNGVDISMAVQAGVHWDGYGAFQKYDGTGSFHHNAHTGFHTYGVSWTPTNYKFYVDGDLTWTTTRALASSVGHVAILSSEVEVSGWSGSPPAGPDGYGDRASSATRAKFDYVRVWSSLQDTNIVPEPTAAATLLLIGAALRRRR